jgi:dTDP-4-amino-4,6-dideoxy-D-glucose/dTDP-4-amino-2,4-dideoxy-beta-L-xylose transaminase
MIPLFRVADMGEDVAAAVAEVLASGFIGQGPKVAAFEEELRQRIGNPYVATVNSGTSGLHLGVRLSALPTADDGDPGEVLSTPLTMVATNWAILANGLRIRWVDVDPDTLNVDLDDLAAKISHRTRAIMVVHFAGYPVDLARLAQILDDAEKRLGFRPPVIEDCAHGWGATYDGKPLGNSGNVAVFSFQAIKHLTCGDGGLMVLPNEEMCRRARRARWFGIDRDAAGRGLAAADIAEWGYKFHMNDISAAIGLANLARAEKVVQRHQDNASFYDRELSEVPGLEITQRAADRQSAFWVYPLRVENRDGFIKHMKAAGITVDQVHERNDLHSVVSEFRAPLPGLDYVAERLACIPVGSWVTDADRQYIADTIKAGW